VLRNLVNDGLEPAEAVARPRMAVLVDGETLAVEADHPDAAEMARADRRVRLMPARHHSFGHAQALVIDGPTSWRAGADPRSDGSVEYVR
jgi:gamma-glutamyltranspeptidase